MIRELIICMALGLFAVAYAQEDGGGGSGPDEGDENVPKVWDDAYAKKQMDRYYTYVGNPDFDHAACAKNCKDQKEDQPGSGCLRRCADGYSTCLRQNCRGDGTAVSTNQPRCYWWHGCRRRMCRGEEANGVKKGPNCPDLPL